MERRLGFEDLPADMQGFARSAFVGARPGDGYLYILDSARLVKRVKNRNLDADFIDGCNTMIAAGEIKKAVATYRLATNCSEKSARFELNL